MKITIRHSDSKSVYTTIVRSDSFASTMETIGVGIGKLDKSKCIYLIKATLCNAAQGDMKVYLANQQDADLFLSAFEEFED